MAEKNYYDILGVKKDASDAEIKKKYRKLVRQYHPDVSDDPDADNKIAEINNAYETIKKERNITYEIDRIISQISDYLRSYGFHYRSSLYNRICTEPGV